MGGQLETRMDVISVTAGGESLLEAWTREDAPDDDTSLHSAENAFRSILLSTPLPSSVDVEIISAAGLGLSRCLLARGDVNGGLHVATAVLKRYPCSNSTEELIWQVAVGQRSRPVEERSPKALLCSVNYLSYLARGCQNNGLKSPVGIPLFLIWLQLSVCAAEQGDLYLSKTARGAAGEEYALWLPAAASSREEKAWCMWEDAADLLFARGAGCAHIAAEAFSTAEHLSGMPTESPQILQWKFHRAKSYARAGLTDKAANLVAELFVTRNGRFNFAYRDHARKWAPDVWIDVFANEEASAVILSRWWRGKLLLGEIAYRVQQARLVREYNAWKNRTLCRHVFQSIRCKVRGQIRVRQAALDIQCAIRAHRARLKVRKEKERVARSKAICKRFAIAMVDSYLLLCWRAWKAQVDISRMSRAASHIQRLRRGQIGRRTARAMLALMQKVEASGRRKRYKRAICSWVDYCLFLKHERAANTIQRIYRCHAARQRHRMLRFHRIGARSIALWISILMSRPVWALWLKTVDYMRRWSASSQIQRWWKRRVEIRKWRQTLHRMILCRRMGALALGKGNEERKRWAMRRLHIPVMEKKAIKIQGAWRAWKARKFASDLRARMDRAAKLLAKVLTPLLEQCFRSLHAEVLHNRFVRLETAMNVQRLWRGFLGRRAAKALSLSHCEARDTAYHFLEDIWAGWRERQVAASLMIACARGAHARKRVAALKLRLENVRKLVQRLSHAQSRWYKGECFSSMWKYVCMSRSATRIAATWRGHCGRKVAKHTKKRILGQQASLSRILSDRRWHLLLEGLSVWKIYTEEGSVAVRLQAAVRGYLTRGRIIALRSVAGDEVRTCIMEGIRRANAAYAIALNTERIYRGWAARLMYLKARQYTLILREREFIGLARLRFRWLQSSWKTWQHVRLIESQAALLLQCSARVLLARATVKRKMRKRDEDEEAITMCRANHLRQLVRRCLLALEGEVVVAKLKMFIGSQVQQQADVIHSPPSIDCNSVVYCEQQQHVLLRDRPVTTGGGAFSVHVAPPSSAGLFPPLRDYKYGLSRAFHVAMVNARQTGVLLWSNALNVNEAETILAYASTVIVDAGTSEVVYQLADVLQRRIATASPRKDGRPSVASLMILNGRGWDAATCNHLGRALTAKSSTVTSLTLERCSIGATGSEALSKVLWETGSESPLQRLALLGCGLGNIGAAYLFHALLSAPHITTLELKYDRVGGAQPTLDVLRRLISRGNLQTLDFTGTTLFGADICKGVDLSTCKSVRLPHAGCLHRKRGGSIEGSCAVLAVSESESSQHLLPPIQ